MQLFRPEYYVFTKAVYKQNYLAYKNRFFIWVIANAITFLVNCFFWIALYTNSDTAYIKGYTLSSMLLYLYISKLVECLTFITLDRKISNDIETGYISISLIKPIQYTQELLFRSFGYLIGGCVFFLPVYSLIYIFFCIFNYSSINTNCIYLMFFIISVVNSFFLNFYINMLFGCLIFKTVKSTGVYELKKNTIAFLSGGLVPLDFFPNAIKNVLTLLPLSSLRYDPIMIFQMTVSFQDVFFIIIKGWIWIIILKILSDKIWQNIMRKLVVYGG